MDSKNKRFLRPVEFAELMDVSVKTIYRHMDKIPTVRIGSQVRFDMESPELREWMRSTVAYK